MMRDLSYSWQSWSGTLVTFLIPPPSTNGAPLADRSLSLPTQHLHRQKSHALPPDFHTRHLRESAADEDNTVDALAMAPTSGGNIWTAAGTVCTGLNDDALMRLISRWHRISGLDMRHCDMITPAVWQPLATALQQRRLRVLRLDYCFGIDINSLVTLLGMHIMCLQVSIRCGLHTVILLVICDVNVDRQQQ